MCLFPAWAANYLTFCPFHDNSYYVIEIAVGGNSQWTRSSAFSAGVW